MWKYLKKWQFSGNFLKKERQFSGNFWTFNWQFSGGSDVYIHKICRYMNTNDINKDKSHDLSDTDNSNLYWFHLFISQNLSYVRDNASRSPIWPIIGCVLWAPRTNRYDKYQYLLLIMEASCFIFLLNISYQSEILLREKLIR